MSPEHIGCRRERDEHTDYLLSLKSDAKVGCGGDGGLGEIDVRRGRIYYR